MRLMGAVATSPRVRAGVPRALPSWSAGRLPAATLAARSQLQAPQPWRPLGTAVRCVLLLLLLVRRAASFPPPFTDSVAYSVGAVRPLPRAAPYLDAANATHLAAVVAARAHKGELVFFLFESTRVRWLDFALNMAAQLTAVGFWHYVALAAFPVDCERLLARWEDVYGADNAARPPPACVLAPSPPHGEPERLEFHAFWVGCWTFLTDVLRLNVSTLLLDLDFAIHRDVYADLYDPCVAGAAAVAHAEGGGANAGFFYANARHADPQGPLAWAVAQVRRRYDLFMAARSLDAEGRPPGNTWEQDLLKDAIRVAQCCTNTSEWDFTGVITVPDHPFWTAHPQNFSRVPNESSLLLPDNVTCAGPGRWNASGTGRFADLFSMGRRQGSMVLLRKPADAPGPPWEALPREHLLYAQGYLCTFGDVVHVGWNNANPPSALTHLLKSRGLWLADLKVAEQELSHVSRLAFMQAFGFWEPLLDAARAAASPPLLFLDAGVVRAAASAPEITHARELVARAMRAAAVTRRTLVLPELPCTAPWIIRSNDSNNHGYTDPRIIVVPQADAPTGGPRPPRCFVGVHRFVFCWPWGGHVAFGFDTHVGARRASARHAAFDAVALRDSRDDVVLTHLSFVAVAAAATESEEARAAVAAVEKECRDYFE